MPASPDPPAAGASPLGVDLAGYFTATVGLSQAARNVEAALLAAGIGVTTVALPARGAPPAPPPPPSGHDTTILCVSPDGMAGARAALGERLEGRRVIGLWWWEVGVLPHRWATAFDGLDEVWVGSRFVADLLAPASPVPVVRLPMPVPQPRPAAVTRDELGLPGGWLFGVVFDYSSVAERKNPLGAIEAFRRAFPSDEQGVGLVLKTIGGDRHAEQHDRVLAAAAGDPRIVVLDAVLDAGRKDALLSHLDCFVSLHRSEGFGLAVAEAMLLAKPVIATDQGGARDFLSAFNAYLVDWRPVPVGPGNDPYPSDAEWAEPDLEQAAALMRHVRDAPDDAAVRGRRARDDVRRAHAIDVAGRAMAARLARAARLPSPQDPLDLQDLERRLRRGPERDERALPAPRSAVRRALLRLLRPATEHQRMVDEELLRALRSLDDRVRGAVAGQQALAAELRAGRDGGERGGAAASVSPSPPRDS